MVPNMYDEIKEKRRMQERRREKNEERVKNKMRHSEDDDGGDNKMRMGDEVYKGSDEGAKERMEGMSDMMDENEGRATHWGETNAQ